MTRRPREGGSTHPSRAGEPTPTLTRWQERTRRRGRLHERVLGIMFALLAIAAVVYFGAVTRLISPLFTN